MIGAQSLSVRCRAIEGPSNATIDALRAFNRAPKRFTSVQGAIIGRQWPKQTASCHAMPES